LAAFAIVTMIAQDWNIRFTKMTRCVILAASIRGRQRKRGAGGEESRGGCLAERWTTMTEKKTDVQLAQLALISNVWLLHDACGRRFVIDAGDRVDRLAIAAALRRAGVVKPGDITAILLTHRHRDHAGNAAYLRERFQCPVICHGDDAPCLEGDAKPPRMAGRPLPPVDKFLCLMEDLQPARSPVDEVYADGKWKWGFDVIPVGGHTAGSVMLYHRPSRTLFAGDAILVGYPPLRMFDRLRLAMPEYSADAAACHRNVRAFLNDAPPIATLCSGHGPLVTRDVEKKLHTLRRGHAEKGGLWLTAVKLRRTWQRRDAERPSFAAR